MAAILSRPQCVNIEGMQASHGNDITWTLHFKSQVTWLFIQQVVQASNKGNIKGPQQKALCVRNPGMTIISIKTDLCVYLGCTVHISFSKKKKNLNS